MKMALLLVFGKTINKLITNNFIFKMQLANLKKSLILISILGVFAFQTVQKPKLLFMDTKIYVLDTTKSKLHWNCAHFGIIKFKEGTIHFEKEQPIKASFTVDMTSVINTDIDNKLLQGTLQNVLKSIEFFNTTKYPNSYFESHSIKNIGGNDYKITGDFIIFDIGICSNFKGSIEIKNDSLYFKTKTISLNRTDWGIYYGSANNPNPKDEEDGFVVTDTILLDAHIQAYLKK